MPAITIYTTNACPYCQAAVGLLRKKSAVFTQIDVSGDPAGRQALAEKAEGRTSVPQIWIGNRHIGGCDDLYALDRAGDLDALLSE